MSTEFTYFNVTNVNRITSNPIFHSILSNLNTFFDTEMRFYTLADDISYKISLYDSSTTEWTLYYLDTTQSTSGAPDYPAPETSPVVVAQGTFYGSGSVHLNDIIARDLSDSSLYPAFNRVPEASIPPGDEGEEIIWIPPSGIYTNTYFGSAYTLDKKAAACQPYMFSYQNSFGTTVNNIFCVLRDYDKTFNPTHQYSTSNTTQRLINEGVFPVMLNQNTSAPVYHSDYCQSYHADLVFGDSSTYDISTGIYLFASTTNLNVSSYSELTAVQWMNDDTTPASTMIMNGNVLLNYYDNFSSSTSNKYCTPGRWIPYATVELTPDGYGYAYPDPQSDFWIVPSSSMPVWDPSRGNRTTTTPRQYLAAVQGWRFGIITVNEKMSSSSTADYTVKTFYFPDYSYTYGTGARFVSCKEPSQMCIRYENMYGATDSLWCNGTRTVEASREPQTYIKHQRPLSVSHSETVYQQTLSYRWTLNTPVMTDEDSKKLINLFSSKRIWIYDESLMHQDGASWSSYTYNDPTSEGLIPVVLEDTSMTVKTKANDKVFNYTFIFRSANSKTLY